MANFDFGQLTAFAVGYKPQSKAFTTANVNSDAMDTAGFEGISVVTAVGDSNIGTNNVSVVWWESDDNTRANATALSTDRVIVNEEINASNTTFKAAVAPVKRYLFAEFDPDAACYANIAMVATLGLPHDVPTT